ncbi:MAG TPA: nitroreductase family protein [Bacteroidales bacterium]|jgi:nitroreductase|nr:nitroreductase family protein [Bacteroidales bacterium]HOX76642.1 nitroreductase family protein [Bacteroidales bacterium]HPI87130.1 nitroreductase family protein [Bacteroidales bacterium]HPM91291.1 nitroreductase family protein [Bacteroidales bacterium]
MDDHSFLSLVQKRQSVRKYTRKPVEDEKLRRCLEAARLAPSASNSQPWKFIVVNDPELVMKVAKETIGPLSTFNNFVPEAPVILAVVIEKMKVFTKIGASIQDREYPLIDIGIAAEHFCLQAAEEGLGTCMLGWFNEKPIKELLKIPKERRIGLLITLGYAPDDYRLREKIRKKPEEMISFNFYKSHKNTL